MMVAQETCLYMNNIEAAEGVEHYTVSLPWDSQSNDKVGQHAQAQNHPDRPKELQGSLLSESTFQPLFFLVLKECIFHQMEGSLIGLYLFISTSHFYGPNSMHSENQFQITTRSDLPVGAQVCSILTLLQKLRITGLENKIPLICSPPT